MDYLASFQLLPLRFAGNQLIVNVPSPEPVSDRSLLLYKLSIYKPIAFQSGTYSLFETLRGREAPPYVEGGVTFTEGCNFDISEFVWGLLDVSAPTADQNTITMQPMATMPIYWKQWVEPYTGTTESNSAIQYILRGKLSEEQFPSWKENFFSTYLQAQRSFLTWQPKSGKVVDRNQPEFLSYLTHHSPAPTQLKVRVDLEFTDGTRSTSTLTPIELTQVSNYTLYTVPVGFTALGLDEIETTTEKTIFAYKVWLSNQNTQRLTEIRRYIVNNDYQAYVRHIVFLNSLGGWDTLRCFGVSKEQTQVTSTTFSRQLEANYAADSEEMFVANITGERRITVNTGYMPSRKWLEYLEEIIFSEKIFVNSNEGLIPLLLTQNTFDAPDDEEDFGGRTFNFRRSKLAKAFSRMPVAAVTDNTNRPTAWVGVGSYCLVSDTGLRTGYLAYSTLELRYTDGLGERVMSVARKSNTPDTLGYIAPAVSGSCAISPYLNTLISRAGSFNRNNCADGYVGQPATIVVAAGTYGSETSLAEAQARAEAYWSALNTQAAANAGGSCILAFKSAAISRPSTYSKTACPVPQVGGKWTVTVALGAYTSIISQTDADNQAIAYANSIDTQANADLYGSCQAGQYYSLTPASGKANVRFYAPTSRAETFNWSTGAGITKGITNDLQFNVPVTADLNLLMNVTMYIPMTYTCKVYRNGSLRNDLSGSFTPTSPTYQLFQFNSIMGSIAAGDCWYIEFY